MRRDIAARARNLTGRSRELQASLTLILIFNVSLITWLLLHPASTTSTAVVANIADFSGPLLIILLDMATFLRQRREQRGVQMHTAAIRRARLLQLGVLGYVISQIIATIHDQAHGQVPLPSWADAGSMAIYPLILLAILRLPTRPITAAARVRLALDCLIVATAAFAFNWYFVLGPIMMKSNETLLSTIVTMAGPLGDLVFVCCLIMVAVRRSKGAPLLAMVALISGILFNIMADSITFYASLHEFSSSGVIALGSDHALGIMLIAFAAHALRVGQVGLAESAIEDPDHTSPRWPALMPYALVPAVGALFVFTQMGREDVPLELGVLVSGSVLLMLVFLRQLLAMREMQTMYASNDSLLMANRQLRTMATTDVLTGLANRAVLRERTVAALAMGTPTALLLLDLDRFKEVNDALGHSAGDALLLAVAERLLGAHRTGDTVARLGGDEFALLLPGASAHGAMDVAQRIQEALATPIAIEGQRLDAACSIGIALGPEHGTDADVLLGRADVAMYTAKRRHIGIALYEPGQDHHMPQHLTLMGELREALAAEALCMYYQPKIELTTGRLVGAEALMRWPRQGHDSVPPNEFIPLAERSDLIGPLTLWALEQALRQARHWSRGGGGPSIAVNLSARALHDPTLPGSVADALRRHAVEPARLTLEVTESALMLDPGRAHTVMQDLAAVGVRLSIDDFGTGYSSLAYLKGLPVVEIKIDQSFVRHMDTESKDAAIVRSVIAMGHALGLSVVAEGVETEVIRAHLASLGCDVAQGYYFARPLPAADYDAWRAAEQRHTPTMDTIAVPWPPAGITQTALLSDRRARVGELIEPDLLIAPDIRTHDVDALFEREPARTAVVLGSNGHPGGLITRQRLLTELSRLYGNALYRQRPAMLVADTDMLLVDRALTLEEAARRATSRAAERRYDPLVATDGDRYLGIITVSALLDHLNGPAMQRMRWSNPLSGLPGAPLLEAEVGARLAAGAMPVLVRLDIAGFATYNDRYGPARGDEVLLALAGMLRELTLEAGGNDLIGHLGGDDFVVLTTPTRAEAWRARLGDRFAAAAPRFHDPEERTHSSHKHGLLRLRSVAVGIQDGIAADYASLLAEATRRVSAVTAETAAQPVA